MPVVSKFLDYCLIFCLNILMVVKAYANSLQTGNIKFFAKIRFIMDASLVMLSFFSVMVVFELLDSCIILSLIIVQVGQRQRIMLYRLNR